jgi:hypothetical protein
MLFLSDITLRTRHTSSRKCWYKHRSVHKCDNTHCFVRPSTIMNCSIFKSRCTQVLLRLHTLVNMYDIYFFEHAAVVVTLYTRIGRYSVRILAETSAILTEVFCGLSRFFQANSEILPQLFHEYFLLNPFQFIIHPASLRYIVQLLTV